MDSRRRYTERQINEAQSEYEELIRDAPCPTCRGTGRVPKDLTSSMQTRIDGVKLAQRIRSEISRQGITMAIFSAASLGTSQSFLSNFLRRLEKCTEEYSPKGAMLRHCVALEEFLSQSLNLKMKAYRTASACSETIQDKLTDEPLHSCQEKGSTFIDPMKKNVLEMFTTRVSIKPTSMDISILADVLQLSIEEIKSHFAEVRASIHAKKLNQELKTMHVSVDVEQSGLGISQQPSKCENKSTQVADILSRAVETSGLDKEGIDKLPPPPIYLPCFLPVPVLKSTSQASVSTQTVSQKQKSKKRKVDTVVELQKIDTISKSGMDQVLASFCPIKPKGDRVVPPEKSRMKKKRTKKSRKLPMVELSVVSPSHDLLDLGLSSELPLFPADVEAFLRESSGVDLSEILLEASVEQGDVEEEEAARAVRHLLQSALDTPPHDSVLDS